MNQADTTDKRQPITVKNRSLFLRDCKFCYIGGTRLQIRTASDPTKSNTKLGWKPEDDFPGLVADMMDSDLDLFRKKRELMENGDKVLSQAE